MKRSDILDCRQRYTPSMNGRAYALSPDKTLLAIETELHGYTIVELAETADVQPGDTISWDAEMETGAQTYRNEGTGKPLSVVALLHLVSKTAVRQHLLRLPRI